MQAILKGKHQRFCDWLLDIKNKQGISDDKLHELEKEMLSYYDLYLQKMTELRKIIFEYEEKQKSIRNRVKSYRRFEFKDRNIPLVTPDDFREDAGILSE